MNWRMSDNGMTSFLTRLRGDTRGNTLAMMAAFLIPLAALTGSAVDVGRMYLVKVRLQQACDAGALAGRKFMDDSNSTTLDANAVTQARTFFANNFPSGIMGTPAYTNATRPYPFTPTKTADNQVAGTATTRVPMTIMQMFGQSEQPLTVTCEARYDIADTDVMFVLDTTGSMACAAADASCSQAVRTYTRPDGTIGYYTTEKSNSKLSGLRAAVMNFYDTMASNIDPNTHVRYGFVTYTSTVNAGAALLDVSPNSFVTQWNYQSRAITGEEQTGSASDTTYSNDTSAECTARAGRAPGGELTFSTNGLAYYFTRISWTRNNGRSTGGTCVIRAQAVKPVWRYGPVTYNVSQYIATLNTSNTVADPSKITGATARWQGCIEERTTTPGTTTFDIDNLPADLDPDLPATSNNSRWRPMWPEVIYYRATKAGNTYAGNGSSPYGDLWVDQYTRARDSYTNMTPYPNGWAENIESGYVSCGKPVSRLATMTRDQVSAYVNAVDFKAQGGTYHDTGMIWGTRLISPTGLFAADTAAWPGRQAPNRFIVFMTDGAMAPNDSLYGMYGMEKYDGRIGGGNTSDLTDFHNARFVAECAAARSRGITVFVIGFGQALNDELRTCASPGQAFFAGDNAALTSAFQSIAKQVAMLRVSK
ncbi:von Willebrand factor type A domain protein [Sphingomonas jeddahensis]|uniref:von Willebrand factor type A domain protein n=2 Tax=Sphingomonas jeddahensis TaxID=1915074 RepID=A0A1V2ESF2_9SPHN|nr:von Willebrand factor type A domain protein [Sphingomonas jeddahensis]